MCTFITKENHEFKNILFKIITQHGIELIEIICLLTVIKNIYLTI